jgi:hypothetical protein
LHQKCCPQSQTSRPWLTLSCTAAQERQTRTSIFSLGVEGSQITFNRFILCKRSNIVQATHVKQGKTGGDHTTVISTPSLCLGTFAAINVHASSHRGVCWSIFLISSMAVRLYCLSESGVDSERTSISCFEIVIADQKMEGSGGDTSNHGTLLAETDGLHRPTEVDHSPHRTCRGRELN